MHPLSPAAGFTGQGSSVSNGVPPSTPRGAEILFSGLNPPSCLSISSGYISSNGIAGSAEIFIFMIFDTICPPPYPPQQFVCVSTCLCSVYVFLCGMWRVCVVCMWGCVCVCGVWGVCGVSVCVVCEVYVVCDVCGVCLST